jgi:hypothetical protein
MGVLGQSLWGEGGQPGWSDIPLRKSWQLFVTSPQNCNSGTVLSGHVMDTDAGRGTCHRAVCCGQ